MRIVALALFLAAFMHAADYPKALLKDPCAATHPCDAQVWLHSMPTTPPSRSRTIRTAPSTQRPSSRLTEAYRLRSTGTRQAGTVSHRCTSFFVDWSGKEVRRFNEVPIRISTLAPMGGRVDRQFSNRRCMRIQSVAGILHGSGCGIWKGSNGRLTAASSLLSLMYTTSIGAVRERTTRSVKTTTTASFSQSFLGQAAPGLSNHGADC